MNLLEIYVSNITMHIEVEGIHRITANFDCYGRREWQKTTWLTDMNYKMVMEKGYYLG